MSKKKNNTSDELLRELLENFRNMDYVHPEDIPNIDLYVDQMTTSLEKELAKTKRYPEDKTITKTMINNYSKNHILPPPEKKKYTQDHMILLVFLYYLKNIISIKDIQSIFEPMIATYFGKEESLTFMDIYNELVSLENEQAKQLMRDIYKKYSTTQSAFTDAPEEEQEHLRRFTFICMLAFDIYIKKSMLESMIDFSEKDK